VALGTPAELKAMVGGDMVTIATGDTAAAAAEIATRFNVEPMVDDGSLRIEVPDAAAFLPKLIRETSVPVTSVTFRRPSLDDVFLKLTGHAIRDEEAGGASDMMRMFVKAHGGRR
jgi:ABC-2 type transport system ATP-binding protein